MSGWRKRTIMEMAREAGFEQVGNDSFQELTARMEAFAKLVREDEREACAMICEARARNDSVSNHRRVDAGRLAEQIRERGQA